MGDTIWSQAACRGPHQEIFFPPTVSETRRSKRRREARAKEICATCTIQGSCLATALQRNEQHGIWGGQTAKERRLLLLS
jgi:WhiB family redox-sensing transcriptional regulator